MRQLFLKSILSVTMLMGASTSHAQAEEGVFCFHIETKNGTSKFLNYLFARYGVEHSEKVLMNTKAYEAENNVFVLFSADYKVIMEKIEAAIFAATNQQQRDALNERKARLVRFESIEDLVNN